MRTSQLALLRQVAEHQCGYWNNGRGYSYRLWLDNENYEVVTDRMTRLVLKGLVTHGQGWRHGKGPMILTAHGRDVLKEAA
jgi:hypothetical protein